MSNQKPLFLMAGGRSNKSKGFDPVMHAVFKEIEKSSPTIAYVGVASEDNWGFYLMISNLLKKSVDCTVKRVLIAQNKADLDKACRILESSDAIFMSGGDVEAGMEILEEKSLTGFLRDLYQNGKLFFGASAGSIMLAGEWVRWRDPNDDLSAELFPCLGLAPIICDTHAEGDDWEELKTALTLKEDNFRGYGIPSGACLKVSQGGKFEAVGGSVCQFARRGGLVIKLEDIKKKNETINQ
jgi:peptidase E